MFCVGLPKETEGVYPTSTRLQDRSSNSPISKGNLERETNLVWQLKKKSTPSTLWRVLLSSPATRLASVPAVATILLRLVKTTHSLEVGCRETEGLSVMERGITTPAEAEREKERGGEWAGAEKKRNLDIYCYGGQTAAAVNLNSWPPGHNPLNSWVGS